MNISYIWNQIINVNSDEQRIENLYEYLRTYDINTKNQIDETLLLHAFNSNAPNSFIYKLIELGADLSSVDSSGWSFLTYLCIECGIEKYNDFLNMYFDNEDILLQLINVKFQFNYNEITIIEMLILHREYYFEENMVIIIKKLLNYADLSIKSSKKPSKTLMEIGLECCEPQIAALFREYAELSLIKVVHSEYSE